MQGILNLAILQGPIGVCGPEARIDWLAVQLEGLVEQNIELVLLPELFLSGYNQGEKLLSWAEPKDGPMATRIVQLARQFATAIHYGFPERTPEGLYNAAQCFAADGEPLCHQRKLVLPPGFEADHFIPGRGCALFSLNGFSIATLICYDAEFPEAFRHVATLGAELVLVPTALGAQWSQVAHRVIPARAFENGVYVAYANHAGIDGDMTYLGSSCIVQPDGYDLARAGLGEQHLTGTIERARVAEARTRLPYLIDRKRLRLD